MTFCPKCGMQMQTLMKKFRCGDGKSRYFGMKFLCPECGAGNSQWWGSLSWAEVELPEPAEGGPKEPERKDGQPLLIFLIVSGRI